MRNVQFLWRDKVTSQGAAESADATVAPSPKRTSNDGKAQQSKVPTDENNDRYCGQNAGRGCC